MRLLPALLCLAGAFPASAQEGEELIGGRYRFWFASLSGHLRADSTLFPGTEISIESDLGIDGNEDFHDFSAWVNIPVLPILDRISVGYWTGGFAEHETLERTLRFAGRTFSKGTEVDAELDIKIFTLTLETFLLRPGTEEVGFALGVLLGGKYIRLDAAIQETLFGTDEREILEGPIPIVGVHAIVRFTSWVSVEAEVSGIGGTYGDLDGYYLEGFIEAVFHPIPQIFVGVGYKFVLVAVEQDGGTTFDSEIRVDGIYLTAGVRF